MDPLKENLVSVAEFNDASSAHITAEMLISNGIDATVAGGVSSYPCFNFADPVKVLVRESDKEEALKLL